MIRGRKKENPVLPEGPALGGGGWIEHIPKGKKRGLDLILHNKTKNSKKRTDNDKSQKRAVQKRGSSKTGAKSTAASPIITVINKRGSMVRLPKGLLIGNRKGKAKEKGTLILGSLVD